jgi:lysozyme family protein
MKSRYSFEVMKPYFDDLAIKTRVHEKRQAEAIALAQKIIKDKEKYLAVEVATLVPWYLIASLHNKESGRNFNRNLCNGQRALFKLA